MKLIPTILVSVGLGATPLLAADEAAPVAENAAADTVPVTIVVASGGG